MSEPIFRVGNHHVESCGDPPIFDGDDDKKYIGYFKNVHGEQWIFVFEHDTRRAYVTGGDAGWSKQYPVVDGAAQVIMNSEEKMWVSACWASTELLRGRP